MGLIKQLLRILFDPRHDWPSNGASLSLLQYSHLSPSDADLYYSLKNEGVSEAISDFLDICESADIKKNLYQSLTILNKSEQKYRQVEFILSSSSLYAVCA